MFAMASNAVIKNGPAASELSLPMRNTASWVRGPSGGRTEYKAVARSFRAPYAGSPRPRHPDTPKHAVVLGAIKAKPIGGRPMGRPALTAPARAGQFDAWVGTKKRAAQVEQRN